MAGLSPRMRGNPLSERTDSIWRRSIPAYAGEPARMVLSSPMVRVYPRVCGGTGRGIAWGGWCRGLSPRMRGNLFPVCSLPRTARSIPAYAGEPIPQRRPDGWWRVYPRVCGGTRYPAAGQRAAWGLSPRMRGNPVSATSSTATSGSIPAYAGEPATTSHRKIGWPVYPRVCGGTRPGDSVHWRHWGLSPRMRGNPMQPGQYLRIFGSIPAYAGEPSPGKP